MVGTEISITLLSITKCIQKQYIFKSVLQKKQIWLEMDSDIILNKPDLNT